MSTAAASASNHWRKQGNDFYAQAIKSREECIAPTIQRDRYNKAIQSYQRALDLAADEDEKCSAAKNLALASWRLLNVRDTLNERTHMLIYHFKEAFRHFSFANSHAKNVKSPIWIDSLIASARSCWEDMQANHLEKMSLENRAHALYDMAQNIHFEGIQSECFHRLTECHFHIGIEALQVSDFKRCLVAMRDCYMPLNEARRLAESEEIKTEVRVLENDVFMHQCMAESIQARTIGDELFYKVLTDEENLNMDMVYEVLDWYKQAILRTREVTEVELEAIALSRTGRVYDKVLKMKWKAKEYFRQAVQLAHSMYPRMFATEEWFKDCTQTLERYQQETVQAEEEKQRKEKEQILKELKSEMKQLEEKCLAKDEEFLMFIYKTFPPKLKKHKLGKIPEYHSHEKLKKLLQKAVVHYHPDTVDVEKHGKKWKVLCEEITKFLTQRYERMK